MYKYNVNPTVSCGFTLGESQYRFLISLMWRSLIFHQKAVRTQSPTTSKTYVNLFAINQNRSSVYMRWHKFTKSDIPHYVPLHVCEDLPDLIAAQPNTLYRSNVDRTVNSWGRRLIDLCKYAGLQICNGWLCASKHTCYKYNGESVVDYLLAPPNLFEMIRNFQIFDKLVYSDHCALSFALSGHGHLRKNLVYKNHREKIKTYPAVYKWNPDLRTVSDS